MAVPKPKPQRDRKIVCHDEECGTEVELKWEDSHYVGVCGGCGIDYGRIYTKKVYDGFLAKINAAEEEEKKKTGKKSDSDWW